MQPMQASPDSDDDSVVLSDASSEHRFKPEANTKYDSDHPSVEYDSADAESDSSSVVYDHESFETFRLKVLEFAVDLWPKAIADDIEISRMSGGGFNRIIGISVKFSNPGEHNEFILRIPRFDAARLDQDVAALRYVRQLGGIPIPRIIAFDHTTKNKISQPYMVQNRLRGGSLLSEYPEISYNAKCRVAAELGNVVYRMLAKRSAVAGKFSLPSDSDSANTSSEAFIIEPFFVSEDAQATSQKSRSDAAQLLRTIFEDRKAEGLRLFPLDTLRPKLMDQFIVMVTELEERHWLQDSGYTLCHLDFEPRNILVDPTASPTDPVITGILDWDSSALAPIFMSCAPPMWIWAWSDDEDEDERTANDVPATEEGRALKQIFEETAGLEYLQFAYPPAYRLARRLMRFAIDGIRSSEDVDEAEAMLKEWGNLRRDNTM